MGEPSPAVRRPLEAVLSHWTWIEDELTRYEPSWNPAMRARMSTSRFAIAHVRARRSGVEQRITRPRTAERKDKENESEDDKEVRDIFQTAGCKDAIQLVDVVFQCVADVAHEVMRFKDRGMPPHLIATAGVILKQAKTARKRSKSFYRKCLRLSRKRGTK